MSQGMIVYLVVVGGVTTLVSIRIFLWIRTTELRNLREFKEQETKQPIRTASPVADPAAEATRQIAESIAARFSVTRKLIVPIVLVLAGSAAALPFLDKVPAASVSVVVAAATVILGLALRPLVENAIAGLVISVSKLISVGDTLTIEGHYGTVEDITTTHTTIKLWDWRRWVVSNSRMLQTEFVNYSLHDNFVWASIEFWIDYSADFDEVERLLIAAAKASPAYAGYEDPRFWLIDSQAEAVLCWGAAWANSPPDAWRLKHDMRKNLLPELARRGWAPRIYRFAPSNALAANLDREPEQD